VRFRTAHYENLHGFKTDADNLAEVRTQANCYRRFVAI
jgi:hypothetical protein